MTDTIEIGQTICEISNIKMAAVFNFLPLDGGKEKKG